MACENKGNKLTVFFFIFFLFILVFPVMSDVVFTEGGTIPLDRGGFIYILADVKKIRPVIDVIPVRELKNWQAVLVLDGTDTAAAALFTRATGRHFQLVGWGTYPSFRASLALFIHRNWKLIQSETGSYWFSNVDRLSIRMTQKQIYTLAWRRDRISPVPAENSVPIPEGFIDFRTNSGEQAPLSLWMDNPGTMLTQMFAREKVRLNFASDMLYLNLYPAENNLYNAELRLQFRNEERAMQIEESLSLINAFPFTETASVLGGLFFANPPVCQENILDFYSAPLTVNEISYLLDMFISQWR